MNKKILKPYEALYPVPVVLVSCVSKDEKYNLITIAWAGVVCSDPPSLSISIRPSRYSHNLIKESKEFVVNIPDEKYLPEVDYCGLVSGREVDKFKMTGFTAVCASKVKAPLVKECPVNIECRVKEIIKLGAHDMFISEIMAVNADNGVLSDLGSVDFSKVSPIVYSKGEYWSLNKRMEVFGFSRKIKKI